MKKQRKTIRSVYWRMIDSHKLIESWSAIPIMENWIKLLKSGKLYIKNQERNIKPSCWLTIVIDLYLDHGNEKELDEFYEEVMASEEALGQDIVKDCFDKYREHGFCGYWENTSTLSDDEKPD